MSDTDPASERLIENDAVPHSLTTEQHPRRVEWTAREALACAYCWSEFSVPEKIGNTPEGYWLKITERARNECRSIANKRLLLAIARGEAVAVPPPAALRPGQLQALKTALGMKADYRVRQILNAVTTTLRLHRGISDDAK